MFETVLAFVAGYLIGSVPLGLLVTKAVAGIDIRHHGTGNTGAANVKEHAGALAAALVALGIFLQGLAPPLLIRFVGGPEAAIAGAAVGAVAGSGWPVFLAFKGGRAVGIATGAAAGLYPPGFLPLVLVYALGAVSKQTSLGVLLGFVFYTGFVFYAVDPAAYKVAAALILFLVAARRLEGLGEELRWGPFAPVFLNLLLFQRRPQKPGSSPNHRS